MSLVLNTSHEVIYILFMKTENRMLKKRKNTKTAADTKTEKPDIFSAKTENTDLKNDQNRKTENPNASFVKEHIKWEKIRLKSYTLCFKS